MKKRIVSMCLVLVLLTSFLVLPAQAVTATQSEMLQVLAVLGVLGGDASGNLNLSNQVTRAEFSKMAVTASSFQDLGEETSGISPFSDVPYTHWAAGYITTARDAGWLTGYLDGTFRPNGTVTLAEAVTVVLKMLGYTDSDFTGTWPSGQMTLYRSLQLNTNISADANTPLTRLECAWLIYNCLGATTKSGSAYGPTMGCPLDATGKPDYLSLINEKLEGPYIVSEGSWESAIGFTPTTVYRNDVVSTASAIGQYDVLYACETISTVYAYSTRHTGTLDQITPNRSAPTAVVLSGVTYTLGTASASYAVSNLGTFQVGDTVTLLMGRDGTVAGIVSAEAMNQVLYGVVTGTGTDIYTNAQGGSYSSDYVDVLAVDGTQYRYATTKDLDTGDLVRITTSGGTITVEACSQNTTYAGTVNTSGTKLGNFSLSPDVEILDVYKTSGKTIPVQRLAGATLSSGDILYAATDAQGAITQLILDDYTGDVYAYGLILSADVVNQGVTAYSSYEFLIDGQKAQYVNPSKAFTNKTGPVQIGYEGTELVKLQPLSKVTATGLTQTALTAGGTTYTLSGNVQVYYKQNNAYQLSSLQAIDDLSQYTVTGYYDKTDREGGRIRILIAEAK